MKYEYKNYLCIEIGTSNITFLFKNISNKLTINSILLILIYIEVINNNYF